MSVHPDKTARRAVDACGGTYSAAEKSSRFAEGHGAALCEAMKAVVDADALTAELLAALVEARKLAVAAMCAGVDLPSFIVEHHVTIKRLDAAIRKATGDASQMERAA